jgi:type I restriction enzyme S subunit
MQVSVVEYKALNSELRLDAEYYKPVFLQLDSELRKSPKIDSFGNLIKEIHCGPFGSTVLKETYFQEGVILAIQFNINNFIVERDNLVYISEQDLKEKKLRIYEEGEIFFSRVGDVRCGVVPKFDSKITISPNIIAVKVDREKINPYYATVFFNSRFGVPQIERGLKVLAQPTIQTELIKNLLIVKLSNDFQNGIANIFGQYFDLNTKSVGLYAETEQILLAELGLANWKPKYQQSFIKNFSDTQSADRIDAEYFQPVYEEIIKAVKSTKNYANLGDLVSIKKCVEPGSEAYQDSGIPFVRVSNLSKFGINSDNQQFISESLYKSLKTHQPKKGEILLSKDATPGIAYYLRDVPSKMIPSSGILRLTVKDVGKIMPEYLTLVLASVVVQKQIERDVGGSVINHWLVDQVKNAIIPILEVSLQKEISEKIAESFSKREKSKSLLEIAKSGVEMAIEKSEEEAKKWLNAEVNHE